MKQAIIPFLAVFMLVPVVAAEPADDRDRAAELHREDSSEFRDRPELGKPIDFENIDNALLDAAVFHETNLRRDGHELPPLGFKPELREAARIQSAAMMRGRMISHRNPDPELETLSDRLDQLEVQGRYFAENVAMVFGVQYESGEPFFSREEGDELILSKKPEGPPIPPHTYQSFAESLLDSWMESPGHRKNILSTKPELLGASCVHARPEDGMDRFYCTQVFYAPFNHRP